MKKIKLIILLFIVMCFTSCIGIGDPVLIKSLNVKGIIITSPSSGLYTVRYIKDSNYYQITFYENELEVSR